MIQQTGKLRVATTAFFVLVMLMVGACSSSGNDAPQNSTEPPAAPPPAVAGSDLAPGTPQWFAREAENFAASQQRGIDRFLQFNTMPIDADPPRALNRWSPARGMAMETSFENRYGATIAVSLFRPNGDVAEPLPSVIIVPGLGQGVRSAYYFLAEDLAEHGYLALVFDPQNQGKSDAQGRPETCDAGGEWQQPQEMGLQEQGSCAGQPPAESASATETVNQNSLVTHATLGTDADHSSTADLYRSIAPTFVLGALDVTTWLLSADNPWRAWVDPARLGLAGHSAGAYGAAQTANGDPLDRFKVAVALDGYHPIDLGVVPRVPTLFILSEQELAPRLAPPQNPRSLHPTWESFEAFRAAGIATGHLILRSSTHLDFTDGAGLASRDGARYASYFTLAWFDYFLKGDETGATRLFATRFDDSVDVSSIGTGAIGLDGRNVPPTIAGRSVTEAYSYYYPGALAALGTDCADLRTRRCVRL